MASAPGKNAKQYSQATQTALLRATNRLFDLEQPANNVEDLFNGILLGHVLHELDNEFEVSHLESTQGVSKHLTNKRNLQAIYKGLFRYIRRAVPDLACQAKKFDYHAIAETPDAQGISQLLAVMVAVATLGPSNGTYIPRIQHSLDRETQAEIMAIITTMQNDIQDSRNDEDLDEAIDAVMEARDMDLLVEEQNAHLRQQLENTKRNLSDYITRLEHLQMSHEELRFEKDKNDRELDVLRKATKDGANNAEMVKALEAQVHEQMDVITRYEEMIRHHEKTKSQLETEVQRLTQRSIDAEELRDQVSEYKHKAEDLEKKANTAERYKQKLESQQHLVKEVQNLQYERAELQEQLRALTDDRERGARTRKAEDELTKMITQSEQHLWDERNQKNQLLKDLAAMGDEVMRLKAQRTHDENFIQDLQDQIQTGTGAGSHVEGGEESGGTLNLEDELNATDDDAPPMQSLEVSRLRAENDLLKRTAGSSADAVGLRREIEEMQRQYEHLQKNYQDLFEQHALSQEQVEALINGMPAEADKAFVNLRTAYALTSTENERLQKQVEDLQAQTADGARELLSVRSQLSAVDKDSIEALEELQQSDKLIAKSLQFDLDTLRAQLKFIRSERDAQKSQLVEALLAKDKLRKDIEAGNIQDLASKDPDVGESVKKDHDKIEKLRARLLERNQQLEISEQERVDLQHQLKAALSGETAAAEKAAWEQRISNLQRENALMATAWHDLTNRLQSNHVVLQRRHNAPKSWLHKQRQMVNVTPKNPK
ncbi:hypothetical protein N3K66_006547 [Trichothecium roseum]|uniref:Uncharacterized protein n=1 Tax=Trichothecium roseum TaxID=47278 RepID=A0ACC0UWZ5_9HYPO|nr:hypothetical protein N3K66_006547 [Trichothecium roseum]